MSDLRSEPPAELLVIAECDYCGLEIVWLGKCDNSCIRDLKGTECPGKIIPVDPPRRARSRDENKRLLKEAIARIKLTETL